jgi:hypothetical protein
MSSERYVLLGLAPPRASWFEAVAQWSTSAAIAAEFVKCVSAEDVRVRLGSGRRYSALLVDASTPSFDRDLVDVANEAATPVVLVLARPGPAVSAAEVGAAAELHSDFDRNELLDVLSAHCLPVGRGDAMPPILEEPPAAMWSAPMFSVCGAGGTGSSTIAIALAQGLASDPAYGRRVLLADLARRADQAMLHDAVDLGPGLQELVDTHRLGRADVDEVWRSTFEVESRGYRLLLGLRRPEAWSALRPRAVDSSIDGLRSAFQVVVADVTGDFEGELEGGSIDVEERNHLSRAAALRSTVVVVVGAPGLKGIHSLANLVREVAQIGVPGERIVTVINRSPRHPRSRAESARALSTLLAGAGVSTALAAPVAVPERKLEDHLRGGVSLPAAIVDPVLRATLAVAERLADSAPPADLLSPIRPGSLGAAALAGGAWDFEAD